MGRRFPWNALTNVIKLNRLLDTVRGILKTLKGLTFPALLDFMRSNESGTGPT
jgi:hypothetical protein